MSRWRAPGANRSLCSRATIFQQAKHRLFENILRWRRRQRRKPPHRPQMAPQTVYFDRLSVNPGLIPARGRKSVAERGVDFREPAARNRSSHFWFEKWRGSSHRCVRVTRVGERALFAYAGLESGASARQPVECLLSANTGFVFHEKCGKGNSLFLNFFCEILPFLLRLLP